MSKADQALEASMRSHRPRSDMSSTPFGMTEQESKESRLVPVANIFGSPFQSRGDVDEAHIEGLMASIMDGGLLVPVLLRRLSDSDTRFGRLKQEKTLSESDSAAGGFELVAGHNRVEAFRRLNRESIPAIVRVMSDIEAARALTIENTQHKSLSDWELYKHIKMLRAANAVKNVPDLAAMLGCSRAQIYNLEAFSSLPESVFPVLDKHPLLIGGTLAYALKPFCETHRTLVEEGLDMLAEGKVKQAGVIGWIQRKVTAKAAPYRREVLLKDADRTIKIVTTIDDARITGDIDFEALHALIEANLPCLRKRNAA